MIASYFSGRTGNLFFQYAYARLLMEARGNKDQLVINYQLVQQRNNEKGYVDALQDFNVQKYITNNRNLWLSCGTVKQKLVYLLFRLSLFIKGSSEINMDDWRKRLQEQGINLRKYNDSDTDTKVPNTKNIILYGKFENSKYFDSIKDLLIKEYTPKHAPLPNNIDLFNVIYNNNSVCIHIRKGDFLSDEFKNDFYVCDTDYYLEGIEYIKKHVDNPIFIFFSNDLPWVKENFKLDTPVYYEPENNPLWETFRLMYSCKHFIISNSTLSWWAQYLSKYSDKIVVCPDHWYNNKTKNECARLIEPNFHTIQCKWH